MILDSANFQGMHFIARRSTGNDFPDGFFDRRIDHRLTVFGAPNAVIEKFGQGRSHAEIKVESGNEPSVPDDQPTHYQNGD